MILDNSVSFHWTLINYFYTIYLSFSKNFQSLSFWRNKLFLKALNMNIAIYANSLSYFDIWLILIFLNICASRFWFNCNQKISIRKLILQIMDEDEKTSISGQQYTNLIDCLQNLAQKANFRPEQPEELTVVQKIEKIFGYYQDALQKKQVDLQNLKDQNKKIKQECNMYSERCKNALRVAKSRKQSSSSGDNKQKNEKINAKANSSRHNQKNIAQAKKIIFNQAKNANSTQSHNQIADSQSQNQRNDSGNIAKRQMSRSVIIDKSSIQSISEHEEIKAQLQKKYNLLEKQSKEKDQLLHKTNQKVKNLNQRMQVYQKKASKTSQLQDTCKDLENKLIDSKRQLDYTKGRLDQSNQEKKQQLNQISSLKDQLNQLNQLKKNFQYMQEKTKKEYDQQIKKLKTQLQNMNNLEQNKNELLQQLEHLKQKGQKQIEQMKKNIRSYMQESIRKLADQNGNYIKQRQQKSKQISTLKDKLNTLAQYIGRFIGFRMKSDGSQSFEDWFKGAEPKLRKYQNCRLEYPYFQWIEKEYKLNQKLAFK